MEDLSDPERRVWDAFPHGEPVDLRTGDPGADEPGRGSGWGPERTIRAEVLTALLRGARAAGPDHAPALWLVGARITGGFSLDFAEVPYVVRLNDCRFEERPTVEWARLRLFDLSGSMLPGLDADSAEFDGHLLLDPCRVRGRLDLGGAQVKGRLGLEGAELADPGRTAVNAERLQVGGSLRCRGGLTVDGAFDLVAARIAGSVEFDGAVLRNNDGWALNVSAATVGGDLDLHRGFTAEGEVRLRGTQVRGRLSMVDAHLVNRGRADPEP